MTENKWQWKQDNWKPMGCSKINAKWKVFINTSLPQETRETSNKQPILTQKVTRKGRKK